MAAAWLSDRAWQRWHLGACLLVALLFVLEALAAAQAFYDGRVGQWGFEPEPSAGLIWLRGEHPAAPVLRSQHPELKPGDWVQFPQVVMRWQLPPVEGPDTLAVTRWREGVASPLLLERQSRALTPNERMDSVLRLSLGLLCLLMSLLLGRQHADKIAYRALAQAFAVFGLLPFVNHSFGTHPWVQTTGHWASLLLLPVAIYWVTVFALRHPQLRPSRWRRPLQKALWPVRGLTLAAVLALAVFLSGVAVPPLHVLISLSMGFAQVLSLLALLAAWRAARGEMRSRIAWLLAALLCGLLPVSLLGPLREPLQAQFANGPLQWPVALLLFSQLASMLGLGYASLKHRVFDFELAVNRTLVYAVAVAALLVVFALLKKLVEPRLASFFFPGQDPRGHEVLNYLLMVVTYGVGHLLFERIDHGLRHLLQHRRLERMKAWREFSRQIPHFQSQDALLRALQQALLRFGGGAGCVLYLRLAEGDFAPVFHALPAAEQVLEADDPLLVRLRTEGRALRLDPGERAALALPLLRRGQLQGLLLMGEKPDRQAWLDDELEAMIQVLEQVKTDLQARQLERRVLSTAQAA